MNTSLNSKPVRAIERVEVGDRAAYGFDDKLTFCEGPGQTDRLSTERCQHYFMGPHEVAPCPTPIWIGRLGVRRRRTA